MNTAETRRKMTAFENRQSVKEITELLTQVISNLYE